MQFVETYVRVLQNVMKPTDTQKGKAIPLETWAGRGGSRILRLPNFKRVVINFCKVVRPTHSHIYHLI